MRRLVLAAMAIASLSGLAAVPAHADNYLFGGGANHFPKLTLYTGTGTAEITALERGWYYQTGLHAPNINSSFVGTCDQVPNCVNFGKYNNYAIFEINSVDPDFFIFDPETQSGAYATVIGATLSLFNESGRLSGPSALSLWDVTTPSTLLDLARPHGDAAGLSIFEDLQSGSLYGSLAVTDVPNGSWVTVTLNSTAVAAINDRLLHRFAIGGTLQPLQGPTLVPEPATWSMLILGFGAVGAAIRSRVRRREICAAP